MTPTLQNSQPALAPGKLRLEKRLRNDSRVGIVPSAGPQPPSQTHIFPKCPQRVTSALLPPDAFAPSGPIAPCSMLTVGPQIRPCPGGGGSPCRKGVPRVCRDVPCAASRAFPGFSRSLFRSLHTAKARGPESRGPAQDWTWHPRDRCQEHLSEEEAA